MDRVAGLAGWRLECRRTDSAVILRHRESRVSGIIRRRPYLALVPERRCWTRPVSFRPRLFSWLCPLVCFTGVCLGSGEGKRPKNEHVKSNFQAPHIMVISIKRKGKARRYVSAVAEAALPQASETDSPRSSSFGFRGLGFRSPSVSVSVARGGTHVRTGKSSPCCLSLIPRLSADSSSSVFLTVHRAPLLTAL